MAASRHVRLLARQAHRSATPTPLSKSQQVAAAKVSTEWTAHGHSVMINRWRAPYTLHQASLFEFILGPNMPYVVDKESIANIFKSAITYLCLRKGFSGSPVSKCF
jgi:hypothetical protein